LNRGALGDFGRQVGRPVRDTRVDRSSLAAMQGLDEWAPPRRGATRVGYRTRLTAHTGGFVFCALPEAPHGCMLVVRTLIDGLVGQLVGCGILLPRHMLQTDLGEMTEHAHGALIQRKQIRMAHAIPARQLADHQF
jgi:hypothetical protein